MQFDARRGFFAFVLLGSFLAFEGSALAQAKKTVPSPTPGVTGSPSLTTPSGTQRTDSPLDLSQQVFLIGRVMFEDGSPINHDVAIERICGGSSRIETHPDSKGHFSLTLGQQNYNFQDASAYGDASSGLGSSSVNSAPGGVATNPMGGSASGSNSGTNRRAFAFEGCELRATYPGYRSDSVLLTQQRALDSPDLGTILLHRLGAVQGTTISLTTAMAPRDAVKAYNKGIAELTKGNPEVAERQFQKAVQVYPQYAIAWFELGRIEQRSTHLDEARHSYEEASKADPKYVSPIARLAALDVQQGKWPEAVETSTKGLALNPVEFPDLWYSNAVSLYQTGKVDEAVKSAKECIKLDTQHKQPGALLVLASASADHSDWTAAIRSFHEYLQLAPDAKNSDAVRKQLAEIEQNHASAQK